MFLLLFFEVLFVGFGWLFWFEVAVLGRDTPPTPLKRGGFGCCFLVGNEMFESVCFPS